MVREREIGTLEQLMVTPISPAELIVGKTLPFLLVGLANVVFVAILGSLWFEVPFRGNVFVLLLGTMLFLSSALGVGLLISTVCQTQQQAFAISFFYITPTIMLSGFGYPITSMPTALQWFTNLDPLRFFLIVLARNFHQGRRTGGAMAADGRDGDPRSGDAHTRNAKISQDARLIVHIGGRAEAALSLATAVLIDALDAELLDDLREFRRRLDRRRARCPCAHESERNVLHRAGIEHRSRRGRH